MYRQGQWPDTPENIKNNNNQRVALKDLKRAFVMKEKYTQLYEKLSQLQRLLQRHHISNNAAYGTFADTSREQGRVMVALKMQDGINTKNLSYLLDIKIPSLNELLNKKQDSI